MIRKGLQCRGFEYIDAKAARRGGGHGGKLSFGQFRRGVGGEQLPDVLRHHSQRGTHLFAHGGGLIDSRGCVYVDGGLRGIGIQGQQHQ
jgi:hypothetical protein